MLTGTVTGKVWSTKKVPQLVGQTFLTVACDDGRTLTAADQVGAGEWDRVLVVTGSSARAACDAPVDALIVGILDAPFHQS